MDAMKIDQWSRGGRTIEFRNSVYEEFQSEYYSVIVVEESWCR